jgi:hypothetical protein
MTNGSLLCPIVLNQLLVKMEQDGSLVHLFHQVETIPIVHVIVVPIRGPVLMVLVSGKLYVFQHMVLVVVMDGEIPMTVMNMEVVEL